MALEMMSPCKLCVLNESTVSFGRGLQRLQQVQNNVALKSSRGKAFPQMWNEKKPLIFERRFLDN